MQKLQSRYEELMQSGKSKQVPCSLIVQYLLLYYAKSEKVILANLES